MAAGQTGKMSCQVVFDKQNRFETELVPPRSKPDGKLTGPNQIGQLVSQSNANSFSRSKVACSNRVEKRDLIVRSSVDGFKTELIRDKVGIISANADINLGFEGTIKQGSNCSIIGGCSDSMSKQTGELPQNKSTDDERENTRPINNRKRVADENDDISDCISRDKSAALADNEANYNDEQPAANSGNTRFRANRHQTKTTTSDGGACNCTCSCSSAPNLHDNRNNSGSSHGSTGANQVSPSSGNEADCVWCDKSHSIAGQTDCCCLCCCGCPLPTIGKFDRV